MNRTALFSRKQKGGVYTVHDVAEHPSNIWFVSSINGQDSIGYGQNVDTPFATLAYALTQAVPGQKDVIYVLEGHAESVAVAGGITIDAEGVSIVGLGNSRNRPTITLGTAVTASINITAPNVNIENMIFDMTGIDGIESGINVLDVDARIADCEILLTSLAIAAEIGITLECARALIERCIMWAVEGGSNEAIFFGAGCSATVRNCKIVGGFANAPIWSDQEFEESLIEDNILSNSTAGQFALEFQDVAVGQIINNVLATDDIATALLPSAFNCFGNKFSDIGDTDVEATQIPVASTTGGTSISLVDTKVDLVDGKIDALGARVRRISRHIQADCTAWTTVASPVTIFTITGDVLVRCFGTVQTGITSHTDDGTLELGVEGNTAVLLAQTTVAGTATRLATGDVWTGAVSNRKALAVGNADWFVIAGGANIILTIATNNMTAGAMTIYCEWIPISANGNVVTA